MGFWQYNFFWRQGSPGKKDIPAYLFQFLFWGIINCITIKIIFVFITFSSELLSNPNSMVLMRFYVDIRDEDGLIHISPSAHWLPSAPCPASVSALRRLKWVDILTSIFQDHERVTSLTIKGCVRLSVRWFHHFWIKYLNTPSQCSNTELNI